MATNRTDKINSLIMRGISDTLGKLKNPHIEGVISVLNVNTSADLKHADVFISIFGVENQKQTFDALTASAGFLRSELARTLPLRTIPMLHFINDDSMEYSRKISDIIKGLK